MNNLFLAATLQSGDYIGFTFFLGSMAMLAATVFFFVERSNVSAEWKMSMTVSGLITGIAAVHYYYMREVWVTSGISPTEFRYIDWILTVPLMVVEFYLLTKVNFQKLVWASIVMLVTGYFGEAGIGPLSPALWGLLSGAAYFYIAYDVVAGEVGTAAAAAGGKIANANTLLTRFVIIGWGIYPLGYLIGTADGQWYSFMAGAVDADMRDLIYNVGDAINKIGFGLVVWAAAKDS
ncbi:xanthorhodopsin [bacterium]|jgi:sensory rhodopsin|nr:MAG: xanthorhodopsin [bacterium]|tara:strand:+ start:330 stop:1034 length:705 start_codon:yes stop_codon:yes gene_type:complete